MERTRNVFLTIFGLTFVAAGLFLLTLLWRDKGELVVVSAEIATLEHSITIQQATQTAAATITPPATATPEPTATPPPDYLATTIAQATATAVTLPDLENSIATWPVTLLEPFDDNRNGWDTEPGDPELSLDLRSIADGVYIWEIDAITGFNWVETLPATTLGDTFYAAIDVAQSGSVTNLQAIAYRYHNASNYYYFGICESADSFTIERRLDGDWFTLSECTLSDSIQPESVNRLAVLGDGARYLFYINEQLVKEVWDNSHSNGDVGVFIDMDSEEQNIFRFDNLEIRQPLVSK